MAGTLSIEVAFGLIGVTVGVGLYRTLLASARDLRRAAVFSLIFGYIAVLGLAIVMWYLS